MTTNEEKRQDENQHLAEKCNVIAAFALTRMAQITGLEPEAVLQNYFTEEERPRFQKAGAR